MEKQNTFEKKLTEKEENNKIPEKKENDKKKEIPEIKSNYLTCKKGGDHSGESLNKICLEENCSLALICCACEHEFHKTHEVFPLKFLKKRIKNDLIKTNQNAYEEILKALIKREEKSLSEFDLFNQKVLEKLKNYKENLQGFFTNYKNFIGTFSLGEKEIDKNFDFLLGNVINEENDNYIEEACGKLSGLIINQKKINLITPKNLEEKINIIEKELENISKVLEKSIIENFSSAEKNINEDLIQILEGKIFKDNIFTINKSHKDFAFKNEGIIAFKINDSPSFSLCLNPLSYVNKSIFGFKVIKKNSTIALGVAFSSIVKNNNFLLNEWEKINNGVYMVNNFGYILSNHDIIVNYPNSQQIDFNLNENDCVYCCFKPNEKKLVFKKVSNLDSKTFNVDVKIEENCFIFPAIYVYEKDDEIEFYDESQVEKAKITF